MDGNDISSDEPQMPPAREAALLYKLHEDEARPRNKVLLVEDDESLRILASIHLEAMLPDHEIVHAEDGKLGFDAFKTNPGLAKDVALIVTDLQMPRVNGIEFAEGLRGINGYRHELSDEIRADLSRVPIVLYTLSDRHLEEGRPEHAQVRSLIDDCVIQEISNKGHGPRLT